MSCKKPENLQYQKEVTDKKPIELSKFTLSIYNHNMSGAQAKIPSIHDNLLTNKKRIYVPVYSIRRPPIFQINKLSKSSPIYNALKDINNHSETFAITDSIDSMKRKYYAKLSRANM